MFAPLSSSRWPAPDGSHHHPAVLQLVQPMPIPQPLHTQTQTQTIEFTKQNDMGGEKAGVDGVMNGTIYKSSLTSHNPHPEIPPMQTMTTTTVAYSNTRSPDSNGRSPSSYNNHNRRLSGSSMQAADGTPNSTSSLPLMPYARQLSTDSASSVSSTSPPSHYSVQPVVVGFSFAPPPNNAMDDIGPPVPSTLFNTTGPFTSTHFGSSAPSNKDGSEDHHMGEEHHATRSIKGMQHQQQQPTPTILQPTTGASIPCYTATVAHPVSYGSSQSHSHRSSSHHHAPPSSGSVGVSGSRTTESSPRSTPQHSPRLASTLSGGVTSATSGGSMLKRGQGFSCHHCFHGDTPVVRSDGFSAPIRDITVGTSVLSYHAASAGHQPTHTSALLDRGTKECIELLFNDGRTVICTPNHRLMTDDGEWVEAGQLSDGVSWIKAGMEYPSILHDAARDSKWSLDLISTLGYTLNMSDRHFEALAFAGLVGYMFGGGDISTSDAAWHLTSRIDAESAMRDVTRLTNSIPPSNRKGSTFVVELPAHLHRALIAVGASPSIRLDCGTSFPPFVLDPACPPAVIQSFLGGLFGSDAGVAPTVNWSGGGELAEVKLCLSRAPSHDRQQRARTTKQLKHLLARLDIPQNQIKANTTQSSNGSRALVWSIPRAASLDFACKIGFRYCCQKQLRLTAASTHYRRGAYIESQRKFIHQYVRAIGTNLSAATFESAVRRAKIELSTTQVIHPDIAAWTPADHRCNAAKRIPGITVKQAIEACDVEKLFRCSLDPAAISVPTFRVQLVGKRKLAEAQHVFDISVPETVNFLAAGLCAHNCKTHKMPELLLFCSNQSKKGPGKKRCRKKYCDSCLRRLYGHPLDQPLSEVVGFQCPACLGNCVCAGCERKTAPTQTATANDSATESGMGSSNSSAHSASPVPTQISVSASPSTGSPSLSSRESVSKVDRGQDKPTTPLGKPPGKKRRTSIDTGISADEQNIDVTVDDDDSVDHGVTENMVVSTSLMSHARPHSADATMPIRPLLGSHTHHTAAPTMPFNLPSPISGGGAVAHTLPPRSGASSNTPSPRLSAISIPAASNRMIQLPFSLQSSTPVSVLHPNSTSIFSSLVSGGHTSHGIVGVGLHQPHTQMDISAGPATGEPHMIDSIQTPHNVTTPGTLAVGRASTSAFSVINAGSSVIGGVGLIESHDAVGAASGSTNLFSSHAVSPNVSPSLMKRLLLNTNTCDTGTNLPAGASTASSIIDRIHKPSNGPVNSGTNVGGVIGCVPSAPTDSNELMKVLANVACTVNTSAALPPAHPTMSIKAESPKMSYLSSPSSMLVSPTNAGGTTSSAAPTLVLTPPMAPLAGTTLPAIPTCAPAPCASTVPAQTALASISAMKTQHAIEMQCLLQHHKQQLADLEHRAMKELEHQQQQQQQHQQPPSHHPTPSLPLVPAPFSAHLPVSHRSVYQSCVTSMHAPAAAMSHTHMTANRPNDDINQHATTQPEETHKQDK